MDSSTGNAAPGQGVVASLLDGRLVMVTGKGGTGKTSYAAALAVLGAAKGKRTVLCEVDNQRPSMSSIFGKAAPFEPENVLDDLDLCNIHWDDALQTYLATMIPSRRIVSLILENRVIGRFLDALPGAREIVILSRIEGLLARYDLVVVDMPASGHAYSMLDITRSATALFRTGPVLRRAHELDAMIKLRSTRLVLVAIPEEMVVNETIETYERMRAAKVIGGDPVCFLNKATLPTLTDPERELVRRLSAAELPEGAKEFVRAGFWEDRLEQATAESRDRLAAVFPAPPVLVPPSGAGGVPRLVVQSLAAHLGRQVGLTRRDLPWI